MAYSTPACSDYADLLPLVADRQANVWQRVLVARHMRGCPSCIRQLAELRALCRVLAGLPESPAPADLGEAVCRRVRDARPVWLAAPRARPPVTRRSLVFEGVAATILIGVSLAWIAHSSSWESLARTAQTVQGAIRDVDRTARIAFVLPRLQAAQLGERADRDRETWRRLAQGAGDAVRGLGVRPPGPTAWPVWALWGVGCVVLAVHLLFGSALNPDLRAAPERT